jgi:hypothetical protein
MTRWQGLVVGLVGVPAPDALATIAGVVEVVGGIAFIPGLLLPLVALLFTIDLAGAYWWFHRTNGFWAFDRGYEWVIALGGDAADRLQRRRGQPARAATAIAEMGLPVGITRLGVRRRMSHTRSAGSSSPPAARPGPPSTSTNRTVWTSPR